MFSDRQNDKRQSRKRPLSGCKSGKRPFFYTYGGYPIVTDAAEPGDPPTDAGGGDIPRWQLRPDAGLRPAALYGGHPVEQQEIHEHEALRGGTGRRFYCRLTSFSRSLQINLRIDLDGTAAPAVPLNSQCILPCGVLCINKITFQTNLHRTLCRHRFFSLLFHDL